MSHPPATPDTAQTTQPLLEKALLTRLKDEGPSLHEVATHLLRAELANRYPDLNIDPDSTFVITPAWSFADDELTLEDIHVESLSRILMRQSRDASLANYLEGEHFLTQDPDAEPTVHLEVSIEAIAQLLNDLAPLLFVAFKEQQLAFWNTSDGHLPRWQTFADSLQKALDVQHVSGWDADQCAIARAVSAYPDKPERLARQPDMAAIQVCLIDIDTPNETVLKHELWIGSVVLHGRYKERDSLLMYSVEYGYEAFDSLQALGTAIRPRLPAAIAAQAFSWRLIEPAGHFFDHMAWAMINTQLLAIEALNRPASSAHLPHAEPPHSPHEAAISDREQTRLNQLEGSIPDWLLRASSHELSAYSQHLVELSTLREQTPDDLFSLPPIKAFAQKKMREAIIVDRTLAAVASLPLDELRITLTDSFTAGAFTLPNPFEHHTQTLGEFALSNSPPYLASVSFKHGQTVPDWLTVRYLTTIAERVDIGRVYPQLIKRRMVDDPDQAPRQKQFYIKQLRALLPLLALECKVRQRGHVDEVGYRYINELVDPTPASREPIVIRPLTLRPQHRLSSHGDNVLNMFIIGPRNPQDGPCLLYRPLLEPPLQQFPSMQNLLYAMHQPGELRDSILAWLPNRALSFNYAQYLLPIGLPSPWLALQPLAEPLNLLEWAGTLEFSSTELTGDIFAALYATNTQAMIELADRQSQSNAQRRWALLEDSGWAVFNVASNFLNGYAGAAVWAWQVFNDLQQALDAHEQGQSPIQWERLGDVLMALAIFITHHANQRRKTGSPQPLTSPVRTRPSPEPVALATHLRPTLSADAPGVIPHGQHAAIATEGCVPRRSPAQLASYLDTLKVAAPDDPALTVDPQHSPPLYQLHDKTYAQAADRWFEVVQDEDENILVLNPQHPSRLGPRLASTRDQTWRVDTSLRLLGAGTSLKSQLKTSRRARVQRRLELAQQLSELKTRETRLKDELGTLYGPTRTGENPSPSERDLQQCQDKTQELISLFEQALTRINEWRDVGGTAGYVQELLRLNAEQQRHINLWISITQLSYTAVMKRIELSWQDESPAAHQALLDDIALSNQLGHAMLGKLAQLNVLQGKLTDIGASGLVASTHLKASAPRFTQWDVKTNEISIAYELCIHEQAAQDMEQARLAVSHVVHRAALASRDMAQMVRAAPGELAPQDQIEQLIQIIDDYSSISQQIDELPVDYPERVHPEPLARVKTLVGEFQHLAQTTLDSLLVRTVSTTSATAGPARPRPSIKIVKTRPREQPRKASDTPDQAPLTLIQSKATRTSPPSDDPTQVINAALELNLDSNGFIRRTKQDAQRPKRVPADMQDIFDQQAQRLEQTASALDTLAIQLSKTDAPLPVATLPTELREDAARMRREGIRTRAMMLKARKPRQSDLQWMIDNGQVRVIRNDAGRIKTQQQQDYFQEYLILDTAHHDQPLWLAHFHYPSLKTPAQRFSAAHLKIADQHLNPLPPDVQLALTTRTSLDNRLRKLSDPLLLAVFLKLERPTSD
ncbi:hypothetical protein SAMN04487857_103196 [Pseudomonas sp. ok272]|uniref:hypothetical protein n=1 Tax=unclassified Pseudomonas TaxID=196821 RepID=UPI0008CCDD79|nr:MULTISPECIES: hypothetical protein [unclassified Pseudomonas]SEM61207.1 hypothetical protein SAMN04487857_103196 [Pseudomonas sp. ok272]SFM49086.1 hypothetical protein SAMN04487858_103239 [Pseudomonas sp. ok602]